MKINQLFLQKRGVHKELKDIANVKHTLRRTTCKHDMMNKEKINL